MERKDNNIKSFDERYQGADTLTDTHDLVWVNMNGQIYAFHVQEETDSGIFASSKNRLQFLSKSRTDLFFSEIEALRSIRDKEQEEMDEAFDVVKCCATRLQVVNKLIEAFGDGQETFRGTDIGRKWPYGR